MQSGKKAARPEPMFLVSTAVAVFLAAVPWTALGQSRRDIPRFEFVQSRPAGTPILAVVSLGRQRVTVYDTRGWIMRAPVSSGRGGYETPAGVYAVIQKEAEHYSNLYEDGYMPFMQRITWSGIALHGGPLPGYPASHGCVRMPAEFAERLFELTKIGMRVIIAPDDPAPVEFRHPLLASLAQSAATNRSRIDSTDVNAKLSASAGPTLRAIAAQRADEARAAAARADAARLESIKKTLENSRISAALHIAEATKSRLEAQLNITENAIDTAQSVDARQSAEATKAKVVAKLVEVEARLNAAMLAAQSRPDVARARAEAEAAEAESTAALRAADEAQRKAAPVSVFVSRKTQQLYVRQSFEPLLETRISLRDPDQPIGTHVFAALDYEEDGVNLRWNVVSIDAAGATSMPQNALDRILVQPEDIERLSPFMAPGSSIIVSDEGLSPETANDTDFIIVMSGEPQGALKKRHRNSRAPYHYVAPYGGLLSR